VLSRRSNWHGAEEGRVRRAQGVSAEVEVVVAQCAHIRFLIKECRFSTYQKNLLLQSIDQPYSHLNKKTNT
jgi:hypothetical protein